jgi:Sec-independent protein translocase protein TatA
MEILGIGPLEFLFILILILLVIGPKDIERTARGLGQSLNRLVRSDNFRAIQHMSQELRNLPQELMREASLEEDINQVSQEINEIGAQVNRDIQKEAEAMKAWTQELPKGSPPPNGPFNPGASGAGSSPTAGTTPATIPASSPTQPNKPTA